jgi:hypothetical protein
MHMRSQSALPDPLPDPADGRPGIIAGIEG